MKRLTLLLAATSIVAACTSASGGSTTTGGTATVDAGTTDTGASAAADTKTTDTGSTAKDVSTPPKDVPPPNPHEDWCDEKDQSCVQDCANGDVCGESLGACLNDKGCKAFYMCVVDCANGKSLPDDVTGTTCDAKCSTKYDTKGQNLQKMNWFFTCVYGNCINFTSKQGKTMGTQSCAAWKCQDEQDAVSKNAAALLAQQCVFNCGEDQDCAAKCQDGAAPEAMTALKAFDDCVKGHMKDADCKF